MPFSGVLVPKRSGWWKKAVAEAFRKIGCFDYSDEYLGSDRLDITHEFSFVSGIRVSDWNRPIRCTRCENSTELAIHERSDEQQGVGASVEMIQ